TRFIPSPSADAETSTNEDDEPASMAAVRCPHCHGEMERWTRRHFSYNTPDGACETCGGLGHTVSLDLEAVFDQEKSVLGGGVSIWFEMLANYHTSVLKAAATHYGLPYNPEQLLKEYSEAQRDLLYYGVESDAFIRHFPDMKPPKTVNGGKFEGVVTGIWRRYKEKGGESGEGALFREQLCVDCHGAKLKKEIRDVTVGGSSISDIAGWALQDTVSWLDALMCQLGPDDKEQVESMLHDLTVRTKRIVNVGLGYLTLNRQSVTLSGGEAQRLRLASILGSGLTGVLYILDEPTAGLHPKDTAGLIQVLGQLRDLGNTVLVIEHDVEMMKAADHVIDMGPGAGSFGGSVVGEGTLEQLINNEHSVTGTFLRESAKMNGKTTRRIGNGKWLTVRDAYERNLKHIDVSFPLGRLVALTGVSGSGKSTLLFDLVAAGGSDDLKRNGCGSITGFDAIGNIVTVDQSPLGRMSRSNVATYTDVFTSMRNLYAGLPEAKKAGLTSKHFSFNTPGGRCEHCQGLGVVPMDMFFLPGLEVRCPACRGKRFKEEVLRVTYKGLSISDLLDLTVQESLPLLEGQGKMDAPISLLNEVGLGYLHWGQSIVTLSGGEGQRIRLAKELSGKSKQHTLYLLDEPSTGLHPRDTKQLLLLLGKLVDAGNSVIVVEHNLDVIRECDWIIDIGPEGGHEGGELIAQGTPEDVARVDASHTGRYLREALR
ncbi:excinuclease ABC subunit UvrA, partial [Paenibacillus sp. MCAF20]